MARVSVVYCSMLGVSVATRPGEEKLRYMNMLVNTVSNLFIDNFHCWTGYWAPPNAWLAKSLMTLDKTNPPKTKVKPMAE